VIGRHPERCRGGTQRGGDQEEKEGDLGVDSEELEVGGMLRHIVNKNIVIRHTVNHIGHHHQHPYMVRRHYRHNHLVVLHMMTTMTAVDRHIQAAEDMMIMIETESENESMIDMLHHHHQRIGMAAVADDMMTDLAADILMMMMMIGMHHLHHVTIEQASMMIETECQQTVALLHQHAIIVDHVPHHQHGYGHL